MKKRNFTLVELVVVLVIFAVFAAVLNPAVNTKRVKALDTACRNNLKQCALAAHTYADSYGDTVVVSGGRGFYHWANFYGTKAPGFFKLDKYMVGNAPQYWSSIVSCPAAVAPARDAQMGSHTYGMVNFRAYGASAKVRRWKGNGYYDAALGDPWRSGKTAAEAYLKLTAIKNASEFILYADSAWAAKSKKADGYGPYPGQDVNAFYIHADWSGSSFGIALRHENRSNIAMADGHVTSRSKADHKDALMHIHSGVDGNGVYTVF